MHPLVRMQRDAMLQARKVQAGNEVDTQNPGFPPAPELVFTPSSSASSTWSPEPSTPYLGSMSPYSPTTSLGALPPPDPLHIGSHAYTAPTHVPSNASSYDAYARQRHDSPQPLLETVYEDLRSGPMTDRSYLGGMSADCIVPSNAVTEWPPYMYNPQSMPQWQGAIPASKPMSRTPSSSTTGFSHHSSASSLSFAFDPSTSISLHDLMVQPPTFEPNEDPFMQLMPDPSFLPPELIPHGTNHHHHHHHLDDTTQLTNFSFQNYVDYRSPLAL